MTERTELEFRLETCLRLFESHPFLEAMREARLFEVGLPGASRDLSSYVALARADEAIVSATGRPGYGMVFALRQLVGRFFIGGFGNEKQKSQWLTPISTGETWPAVAISEPGVGAHPKLLSTSAMRDADSYVLSGSKTWITNGGDATVFLVLAATSIRNGRKTYGMFLVPRETAGLEVKPMNLSGVLAPATHVEITLNECRIPADNCLGDPENAYKAMAEPFRDVEDIVATAGQCGLLEWLIRRAAKQLPASEDAVMRVGRLAALVELCRAGAYRAIDALDRGSLEGSALAIGIRLLAGTVVDDVREMIASAPIKQDPELMGALAAFDLLASTARKARTARQVRVGTRYFDTHGGRSAST